MFFSQRLRFLKFKEWEVKELKKEDFQQQQQQQITAEEIGDLEID